jgi:hypothetical protein
VLTTGAAGRIASVLRPALREDAAPEHGGWAG